jgi:hypothetical protein
MRLWYEQGMDMLAGTIRSVVEFPDHPKLKKDERGVVLTSGVLLKDDCIVHPMDGPFKTSPPPHSSTRPKYIEDVIPPPDKSKWVQGLEFKNGRYYIPESHDKNHTQRQKRLMVC